MISTSICLWGSSVASLWHQEEPSLSLSVRPASRRFQALSLFGERLRSCQMNAAETVYRCEARDTLSPRHSRCTNISQNTSLALRWQSFSRPLVPLHELYPSEIPHYKLQETSPTYARIRLSFFMVVGLVGSTIGSWITWDFKFSHGHAMD